MAIKTERMEARVSSERRAQIERDTAARGVSASAFTVSAAVERADEIIADATTTTVPADSFDRLVPAVDDPDYAPTLTMAAERARGLELHRDSSNIANIANIEDMRQNGLTNSETGPSMNQSTRASSTPDESVAEQAASAVAALGDFLRAHPTPTTRVRICVDDSEGETPIVVPAEAFRLFVEILAELANGNAVTVVPIHAELTTQQAADTLNVSRPFLIGLLEDGKIPFRRVGNRRKVLLADVLEYKRRDDQYRDEVLRELTAEAEDHDLGY